MMWQRSLWNQKKIDHSNLLIEVESRCPNMYGLAQRSRDVAGTMVKPLLLLLLPYTLRKKSWHIAAPLCDYSQQSGILYCRQHRHLEDFTLYTLHWRSLLWKSTIAVSPVGHDFHQSPVVGHCRLVSCTTTSHPCPAMPAFPNTQAPLPPHPSFITASQGGILAGWFGPSMPGLCLTHRTVRRNKDGAKPPLTASV